MTGLRFDDRVAIVTGAGGGLGRAYALLLASLGAKVVINDLDRPDESGTTPAAAVVAEIEAAGGSAVAHNSSVSVPGAGEEAVAAALDTFGRLDILVNNAGVVRDRTFARMSDEELQAVLGVHFFGTYHFSKAAWPVFRDRGYGRIVLTTSVAGLFGNVGQANYASAKASFIGLGRTLAQEGGRNGIKVNLISPAAATGMTKPLLSQEQIEALPPEQVAPVVAYLSHEANELTGQILYANAGTYGLNFIATTTGYTNPAATIDDIAANVSAVTDTSSFTIPTRAF